MRIEAIVRSTIHRKLILPEIFSKYCHINTVTDSNISYEITNAVTYNVYVLQNNSVYLNGLIKSPVSYN